MKSQLLIHVMYDLISFWKRDPDISSPNVFFILQYSYMCILSAIVNQICIHPRIYPTHCIEDNYFTIYSVREFTFIS